MQLNKNIFKVYIKPGKVSAKYSRVRNKSLFLHFLTAILLPHGQLWVIIKGEALLTRC